MTPLIEIAARHYPDISRDVLANAIDAISSCLNVEDERYMRAIVLLLLRAHFLDRHESLAAAAVLLDCYGNGAINDH